METGREILNEKVVTLRIKKVGNVASIRFLEGVVVHD